MLGDCKCPFVWGWYSGPLKKKTIERYFLARASLTALHASVSVEERAINRKSFIR
jgi:hypothetical protein